MLIVPNAVVISNEAGFFFSIYVSTFTALTMTILYMLAYFLKWADNTSDLGLVLRGHCARYYSPLCPKPLGWIWSDVEF